MVLHAIILSAVLVFTAACSSDPDADDWHRVSGLPEVFAFGSVWSFGPQDVWVTAEGGRVLHFDGSDWDETKLETTEGMQDIWAFAPDDIWMVGGETLARFDGSEWTITDFSQSNPGIEGLNAIWGTAPDDVWVVGTQSTAAHWDGNDWQRYIAAGTDNTDVWGSAPDDVYVAGVFDIAHWDGTEWTDLDTGLFSGGEGIWGFGPDDVWIADGSGEVTHWDGNEWRPRELEFMGEASALWGSAPDDLWGVGSFGAILHYDGDRWSEVLSQQIGSPYLRVFTDVHGSSASDVWVVGTESGEAGQTPLLYRYDPN